MSSEDTTKKLQQYTHLPWLSASHIFAVAATCLAATILPWRYFMSGAPSLTASILMGSANGYRILPFLNLWVLLIVINMTYAMAATSWLLYWVFAAGCYPMLLLSCLYQFEFAADFARKNLRRALNMLDFTEDKIAFFDIPALEIDTPDVKGGLMVIRGMTFILSSLTVICHGIEVGIKLTDDMELALVTDELRIEFFRRILVGDCYGNLKGGEYEMTFGQLAPETRDASGEHVMFETDTPIMQTAAAAVEAGSKRSSFDMGSNGSPPISRTPTIPRSIHEGSEEAIDSEPTTPSISRASTMQSGKTPGPPLPPRSPSGSPVKMTDKLTGGAAPDNDTSPQEAAQTISTISPANEDAARKYRARLEEIADTSVIKQGLDELDVQHVGERYMGTTRIIGDTLDSEDKHAMRAATCSWLHDQPSIPHPTKRSIKVSTLQHLSSPRVREFLHRLPFLLRLLLNPLAYFHPVVINSITAGASGKWIETMLSENVFKNYPDQDHEIKRLWTRVSQWLTDANFVLQLGRIDGQASVPLTPAYDIENHLSFNDVMAYRTVSKGMQPKQVVRLGGADARISVPSFLLPHHEHLLPPIPSMEDKRAQEAEVRQADGHPKAVQAEHELSKLKNDECTGKMSVHIRLPAQIDQELLNFVAALVKATKLIEMDKSGVASPPNVEEVMDETVDENLQRETSHGKLKHIHLNYLRDVKGFTKDLTKSLAHDVKHKVARTTVDAVVNDRWIAKMVGKIAKHLESAMGDVGYSGDLPISLEPYRKNAEPLPKILP